MKTPVLFCLLLACIGFQSCKKNENPKVGKATQIQTEKSIAYSAIKRYMKRILLN